MGLLKTHSKDAIYHMLDKALKFSITKMQCTQEDQEDFILVVTWAKKDLREMSKQINLENVELFSQMTREQPIKASIN